MDIIIGINKFVYKLPINIVNVLQALQESSLFSDKLEGMLRALTGAADQLQHAEPVSAHPPKIEYVSLIINDVWNGNRSSNRDKNSCEAC